MERLTQHVLVLVLAVLAAAHAAGLSPQDQEEQRLKRARGWKEVKGELVSKAQYSRLKEGLVEHEGHWVKPGMKRRIEAKGMVWREGRWWAPEEVEKLEKGLRLYHDKWVSIEKLNEVHDDLGDPWKLMGDFVEVHAACPHARALKTLDLARDVYRGLADLFGEDVDVLDKRGRLLLVLARDLKQYQTLGAQYGRADWEARHSSTFGAFYASSYEGGRGAGCTYAYEKFPQYVDYWVGYLMPYVFVDRYRPSGTLDSDLMKALGGYAAALYHGKYAPGPWIFGRFIYNSDRLTETDALKLVHAIDLTVEPAPAQAGFFLHFLQDRNPEAFKAFWRRYLSKGGSMDQLIAACFGEGGRYDRDELNKAFKAFVRGFRGSYRPETHRK